MTVSGFMFKFWGESFLAQFLGDSQAIILPTFEVQVIVSMVVRIIMPVLMLIAGIRVGLARIQK